MPGVLIWAVDLDKNNALMSAVVGHSLMPVVSDKDCPADGVWPRTGAGKSASVPCSPSSKNGPHKTRLCGGPNWADSEDIMCNASALMMKAFGHCEL